MDRKFRLAGEGFDLEILKDYFHTSRTMVEKIEDQYFLRIEGKPWTKDDSRDWSTAEDELSQINGIAKLLQPNFRPVTIAGIETKDPVTGNITSTLRVRCAGEFRTKASVKVMLHDPKTGNIVSQDSTTEAEKILSVCDEHEHLARALLIYGALPHEWRQLSMVVDAIEDHHGGKKKLKKMDYCPGELRAFKRTANSWKALRLAARHGRTTVGVKTSEIALNDAREVIRRLLEDSIKYLPERSQ